MPDARFALWRDRSLRFSMGATATIVTGLTGILRNKWFAQHLEASGIGILAQIISSQGWLGTAAGMGLGLPVARAVGAAAASDDPLAARRTVWAAFTLLAMSSSAVIALGLFFAAPISRALLGTADYATLIRISMVGVAGVALQQTLFGLFAGRSDLRAPLTFAIVGGGLSVAAAFLLVPRLGLTGAALAAAVLFPAGCAGMLFLHRREYRPVVASPPKPLLTPGLARVLLKVAGAGLLSSLVEQGTLLALRSHYVRANGIEANGYLQAGLAISQQVGSLFYAYLASYAFGKISGVSGVLGAEGARAYTRKHWGPLMLLAAAALVATRLGATPLLHLLYSHRFDPAEPLMAWALVGEYGRIGLLTVALGSLPLGGAKLWLPISLVFPATLAIAYAILAASGAGLLSMPKAYAVAGIAAACVGGVIMGRRGVTLGARDLMVFGGGAVVLALLAAWTRSSAP
jgi:O-antigen/teichoic acid export membrane protein